MGVGTVDVISDNLSAWGVQVHDYTYDGVACDFQDLLVQIAEQRATSVEKEIEPMSTRMTTRNTKLDQLGDALAIVADVQAKFTSDDISTKYSDSTLSDTAKKGLEMIGFDWSTHVKDGKLGLNKSESESCQQKLKTLIDSLNNDASKDMTRLQSLVDKRDESYSTATSLMQAVGDTRANTIKNM